MSGLSLYRLYACTDQLFMQPYREEAYYKVKGHSHIEEAYKVKGGGGAKGELMVSLKD